VAISAALITWLVADTDLNEVLSVIGNANGWLLALAFSMFYVGYGITAARWSILQRALGGAIPYWVLVQSFMVAVFFNNFLPSTTGGDVVRMYDSWRSSGSKSIAIAAVLMDRIMGVTALLTLAIIGLYLGEFARFSESNVVAIVLVATALMVAGLLSLIFVPWTLLGWAERLNHKLPGLLAGIGQSTLQSVRAFRARRGTLLVAFGLSLALQANVVVFHWIMGEALNIDVSLAAYFVIVPIAIVVMMIPISINGIGVRESIFVMLLGASGVSQTQALAYAWLLYVFILLQGLIGGVVFAFRSEASQQPAAAQPIDQSVSRTTMSD
jgi:hypothetical protein